MNPLLNPNVAYMLLVIGLLISVLAMFSPGTGIFEIGALFMLLLAAYSIFNLPVNLWAFALLAIGIVPFVIAVRSKNQRQTLLMLIGALLAFMVGSAFLFRRTSGGLAVNPILILVMSLLAVGATWLMARKSMEAITSRPTFDLDQLIGMTGRATSDIRGQGTAYVNGEEWTATSQSFIPEGKIIRVVKRRGLMLEVEQANTESPPTAFVSQSKRE